MGSADGQQAQRGMASSPADDGAQAVVAGSSLQHSHVLQPGRSPQLRDAGMQQRLGRRQLLQLCQPWAAGERSGQHGATLGRPHSKDLKAAAGQGLAHSRRQAAYNQLPQVFEVRQRVPTHSCVLFPCQRALQQAEVAQGRQASQAGRQAALLQVQLPQAAQPLQQRKLLRPTQGPREVQPVQVWRG